MTHANAAAISAFGGPVPWTSRSTLASIALQGNALALVLARHGLDFCCGGKRPLDEACTARSVDVNVVLSELESARRRASADPPAILWDNASATAIVRHVVETHHAYTRAAFERIEPLLAKVVAKHGPAHPELDTVKALFNVLAAELTTHLAKEETILFPYVVSLESDPVVRRPPFQTVANPVRMMRLEHDEAAAILADLANTTNGFAPPAGACASFTALYGALADLRTDLFVHISIENNVLFPKAIELEATLALP